MKNFSRFLTVIMFVGAFSLTSVKSQISTYSVSDGTSTFSSISGVGTALTFPSADDDYVATNLPFAFNFGNVSYASGASIYVTTNGYVVLNTSYNSTTPPTSGSYQVISPFGCDLYLNGLSTSAYVYTSGTSPNRVFTIEWTTVSPCCSYSSAANFNFQIKLYEGNRTIQFVYGSMLGSQSPYIFLMEYSNSTNYYRSITGTWTGTISNNTSSPSSITTASGNCPASGRTFTFSLLPSASVTNILSPSASVPWGINLPAVALIGNVGIDTIRSCNINWSINGVTKTPLSSTKALVGSVRDTIQLGTYTPDSNALNTMKVWVYNTNPTDAIRTDDTLSISFYACTKILNGTYTIGGASADFSTLTAAVNQLVNCGISGPVTFLINNGTYSESINIAKSIPGASTTNTVTFQSATGNADSVQIYVSGSTIRLSNTAYLRFKNLTIGTTSSVGTVGVEFVNNVDDILFYGCTINASNSNTSSTCAPLYYNNTSGSGYRLNNIRIIKNHIDGGYSNIYFYYAGSGSGTLMSDLTIDSNTMTNAYYYGIRFYSYTYCKSISYNDILMRSGTTNYVICVEGNYNTVDTMVGNRIRFQTTGTRYATYFGAYLNYNSTYRASGPAYIANNEFISSSSSTTYGFYFVSSYYNANVLHNSVYLGGSSTCYGFYLAGTMTSSYALVVKNNIFAIATSGTGYPIYVSTASNALPTNGTVLDYNNYYTTGTNIGYIGSAVTSLSGLQTATSQDVHSISLNPLFLNPNNNLHTNGFDMLTNTIPSVPVDINKVSRKSITNLGCYHDFDPYDHDVKLLQIVSPGSGLTTGQKTALNVVITNMGLDTLDSVRIHWSINNGALDSMTYYCHLGFSGASSVIALDSFIALGGVNSILVYTTFPDGFADEFPTNDTLQTTAYGCGGTLSGSYVVGTNGNFANLNEALTALYYCGISGPVVLQFMPGIYGSLTFTQNVPGASATNTVTFSSALGNADSVIFLSVGTVALTLNNVNNFIFKKVTFDATLGTHGVEFLNTCSNILFNGCTIKASLAATSDANVGVRYYNSSGSGKYLNNVKFIKNKLSGGYSNFYFYYSGSSATEMSNGSASITIDSNILTDAYYYGVYSYYYGFYPSISYNTITSRSSVSTYYGIYTYYYHTIPLMVGNKIRVTATTTGYGMRLYYYHNYSTSYGSSGPGLLANNEVIVTGGSSTCYGIYAYYYSRWNIVNNSIYVGGTSTSYGLYPYTTSTTYPIDVQNNVLITTTSGTGYPIYISSTTYATSSYGVKDYNNYYSTGSYLGYIGSAMSTLAAMKAYQNANSVNVAPTFINLNNSLELSDYSGILCSRNANVLKDIKGENRTTLTPMGAYSTYVFEGYDMSINAMVEPVNTDEVFCYQNYASVRVAMSNKGSLPINFATTPMILKIDVQGAINFQEDTIINIGSLSATMKDTFVITDLLPVSLSGVYNIKVWLELAIDQVRSDDTLQSAYIIDKISIPYNINFDSIPKGLVFKQMAGTSGWSVQQGTGINPTISPTHGTGRLQFLSETGKGSMAKVSLQPFNLQGSASPQMKFWYAHDDANPLSRDYTDVKISIDGGFTYSTIMHLQRYNSNYTTPTFVKYEINLSPYLAYSCVIIAFEAGSYGGGNQNIDSIALISKQDLTLNLEVPEQSSFVACELENKTINVNLTNMTAQTFKFDINPSQINVKVKGAIDTLFIFPLTSGEMIGDTTLLYNITHSFDFSTKGTYDITAYLTSADDNTYNDTVKTSRVVNVDAELLKVDSIGLMNIGDLVYPCITITNNGNMPINQIPMSVLVNNVQAFTEIIDTLMNPGDTINYTFKQAYSVPIASEQQPYYQMKVQIDLYCDGKTTNNSSTKYYDVYVPGSIDLSITTINKPEADSCKEGFTKIYPSIEIFNAGTGYAQGAMLYVFVDSAGIMIDGYSEVLDDVAGQSSIIYTCNKGYIVPNFTGNYTVGFTIEFGEDKDKENNNKNVITCSRLKETGINKITDMNWSMGQNIPNPANLSITIPYTLPIQGMISFKVISINGQLLFQEDIDAKKGYQTLEFNTETLANGIYYYSIEYQGERIVKKMTIQK